MLFRDEVLAEQSHNGMGDVIIHQPRIFSFMTAAALIISIVMICVATLGTYSRKETVPGYLAPQSGIASILAVRGGVVTDIAVAEGEYVEVGDALARLSLDTGNPDTPQSLASQIMITQQRIDEAQLQYGAQEALFDGEAAQIERTIRALDAEIEQLQLRRALASEGVDLAQAQWERWQGLYERGLAPNIEVERLRLALLNAQSSLQDIQRLILERDNQRLEARQAINLLPPRRELELSRARSTISALEQTNQDLERAAGYVLSAPIAGRITSVQATLGQTVRPDRPLAAIVPDGERLRAHLLVPTSASGFIEPGQTVRLRIDAFHYQRFGTIEGRIVNLSSAVLTPAEIAAPIPIQQAVYRLTVDLSAQSMRAYGIDEALQPGMTLSADVIVDERPLWRWFIDPIMAIRQ